MTIQRKHWETGDALAANDLEGAFVALENAISSGGSGPGVGGTTPTPGGATQIVTVTSASLAPGFSDATKSSLLGAGALIGRVQTNVPAWVRVYPTSADRAADAGRGMNDDPGEGVVVALEFVTSAARLTLNAVNAAIFDPEADGWPMNIVNLGGTTGAVITTLTIRSL